MNLLIKISSYFHQFPSLKYITQNLSKINEFRHFKTISHGFHKRLKIVLQKSYKKKGGRIFLNLLKHVILGIFIKLFYKHYL